MFKVSYSEGRSAQCPSPKPGHPPFPAFHNCLFNLTASALKCVICMEEDVQYIFLLKNVKEDITWEACNHQMIESKS
jgi:hypothetical protein